MKITGKKTTKLIIKLINFFYGFLLLTSQKTLSIRYGKNILLFFIINLNIN